MGLIGCLYHVGKSAVKQINGDSTESSKELDKAIESLRRPPLSELGDALSDLGDSISDHFEKN